MQYDKQITARILGDKSAYGRKERDFYPTPEDVTQALIDYLSIPKNSVIWEPACGNGALSKVLKDNQYQVIETDIIKGQDFLTCDDVKCDWVITNPPFSLSEQFIERCASTGKPFALLLKSQYWHAKSRLKLFKSVCPSHVLPLTWRPDFLAGTRGKGSPFMDMIWVVWRNSEQREYAKYVPLERPKTRK